MKNNWDHNVSRKIRSEYEEAKYPLPDVGMEWEKFSATLPDKGKGGINLLEFAGFFSMVVICVVVCLLTGNKLNNTTIVQKENIKTAQQNIASNHGEEKIESIAQTEKNAAINSESFGVKKQLTVITTKNTESIDVEKEMLTDDRVNTQKIQPGNNVAGEPESAIVLPDNDKAKANPIAESEPKSIVAIINADSTGLSEQLKAINNTKDSAVKALKPKTRSTILRMELFLNGTNALTPVKTMGGGIMAGLQFKKAGISSGLLLGSGHNDLRYMGIKSQKTYWVDSSSNYVYTDSLNAVSSRNVQLFIPVEFSYKLGDHWQVYTRAQGGIAFKQNYLVDHRTNLRDSAMAPMVTGELSNYERYRSSLKALSTSFGLQLGARYSYKKFSLGIAGSLPVYNSATALLEKHFEQQGYRIGQRPQNSIFYTFSLGYNF